MSSNISGRSKGIVDETRLLAVTEELGTATHLTRTYMTVTSSDQHDRGSCGQVEKPVSVRLDHVQRRFVEIPIGGYAFMKGNNEGDQSTRHTEEITYVPASQPRRRNTWAPDESRLLFDKKVGPRGSDMVDRGTEVETMQVQNVGVSCHGEGCIMDACHGIETCSVSASWPHSVKMVQQILFQNIDAEAFHDWLVRLNFNYTLGGCYGDV